MYLARQQPRRGTGHDDLDLLGIEHPAHEAFPAGYELDFVEIPTDDLAPAQPGMPPVVFLEQEPELLDTQVRKAIVVEAEIQRPLRPKARAPLMQQLMQESGLSGAAHADDRVGLARHGGQARIATCQSARFHRRPGGAQLLRQDRMQAHA